MSEQGFTLEDLLKLKGEIMEMNQKIKALETLYVAKTVSFDKIIYYLAEKGKLTPEQIKDFKLFYYTFKMYHRSL